MLDSEQHHYCLNLIEVNKKQPVTANQPILNHQGVLLLAQGSPLDEKRSQVLLQHKLLKPLEHCVGIAESMDAQRLFDYLNKFARNLPGLYAVTNNEGYQKSLRLACLFYEKFPLLRQNLTVLALRARHIYFQGIFSALAGVAIARKLNLSLPEIQATFIAGLFHDVGFLYLPADLREKKQDFLSIEWKALQAHPLIAQRFLDMVPGLPKDIGQAIIDHHERIDGTGYPRHLFGDKISLVSQIIAATDTIIYNHSRYEDYGVHAHAMLLSALKLSDNIYFESVYDAASLLFKEAPLPTEAIQQLASAKKLLARQKKLRNQFGLAKQLAQQLVAQLHGSSFSRSISAAMGRLAISVVRSGILQPEQEEWLEHFDEHNNSEALSLIEISVMQDQIYDQLIHLKNLMERLLESLDDGHEHYKNFSTSLQTIDLQDAVPV
ncbi:HD-GYP domain-containing protein [Cellvibrio mixtus]|uniref:HD-GYP domain-containing protein n=1 Tax=Cellvibrio mixtus TaxID=39650 RepID=UPI000586B03F|nr:HD domain-containing phosphohydrolase [Cellvibrio mixtus]